MTIDRWPIVVKNNWKNIMLLYQSISNSYFQGIFQQLLDEISLIKGLICFSGTNDSILMWSHYAKGHTGIVIEFGQFPLWNKIKKVKYSIKRIPVRFGFEIVDLNDLSEVFFTKNISWKYEQEFRLEINLSECLKSEKDYSVYIPKTVIKSIYFGIKTTDNDIIKIKNIVNPNISFFKAKHNYSRYKIDFAQS